MHVALLTNFIPPYRAALYEEIANRVDRLTILVSQRVGFGRPWPAYYGTLDVVKQRTLALPARWSHPSGFSEPIQILVPLDTIPRLRGLKPDIVISAELGMRTALAALYCSAMKIPLVVWATISSRSEQGRGRPRERLRKQLLRRADAVIVNGAEGLEYVERIAERSLTSATIPYTADPDSLYTGTHPARPVSTIVYVGQLSQRKAVDTILWALAATKLPLKLIVVGDGPERNRLESTASRLGLDAEFPGMLQPVDMPAVWAQADALVFPTLADEWGLVTNEALHSGVPVIGSMWAQSVNELVHDGVNGWRFDPSDPESLAERLSELSGLTPSELTRMRERCRNTAGLVAAPEAAACIALLCGELDDRP